jgi:hypothetical protein
MMCTIPHNLQTIVSIRAAWGEDTPLFYILYSSTEPKTISLKSSRAASKLPIRVERKIRRAALNGQDERA